MAFAPVKGDRSEWAVAKLTELGVDRILAGTGSFQLGSTIQISSDFGKTWKGVKQNQKFPKGSKAELKHIWQIVPGHASEPGTWFAGTDDAALFVSRDDGATWKEAVVKPAHADGGWQEFELTLLLFGCPRSVAEILDRRAGQLAAAPSQAHFKVAASQQAGNFAIRPVRRQGRHHPIQGTR